jgi:hypothetical protein
MPSKTSSPAELYTTDFYRWAMETAAALRQNRLGEVDLEHIAEELESLGRTEQRELRNRLKQLLLHILKWKYQPAKRSVSWQASINLQRSEIGRLLQDNPSLKPQLHELACQAYADAVHLAVRQTGLAYERFPAQCPVTADEALSGNLDELA